VFVVLVPLPSMLTSVLLIGSDELEAASPSATTTMLSPVLLAGRVELDVSTEFEPVQFNEHFRNGKSA